MREFFLVHTAINMLDLIVFSVIGLSALLSFFRGFLREVLSLGAWVGATIITLYAFDDVSAMLEPQVNSPMVANGFAALFTFMGALIILSVFTGLMLKFLKSGAEVGVLNNLMGLLFGVARGALLVAVTFYIYSLTTTKENYPDWAKASVSLPYVEVAAAWVAHIAPDYLDAVTGTDRDEAKEKLDDAVRDAEDHTDDIADEVESDWPKMDDLKDKMNDVTGGGY